MMRNTKSLFRIERLLSLLIRILVAINFAYLIWVFIDFTGFASMVPGPLQFALFWWYLFSIGLLPLFLCLRVAFRDKKGAWIDAVLVSFWIVGWFAYWHIPGGSV